MKRKVVVSLVVLLVLLAVVSILYFSGSLNLTGNAVKNKAGSYCAETDNGNNKDVKGMVSNNIQEHNDYCFNSYRQLKEYYCDGVLKKEKSYACDCKDGACVENATGPDVDPPYVYGGIPDGTQTIKTNSVFIQVKTNEPANCKYSLLDLSYYNMNTSFYATDGMLHNQTLNLIQNGNFVYWIRCIDRSGNTNSVSYGLVFYKNSSL